MFKQAGWRILAGGLIGLMLLVSGIGLLPAADNTPNSKTDAPKSARAIIKTKFGDFVKLAKAGFYNGTIFHRVIPGFMIQGGDPNTKDSLKKDTYGQGGPGHTVKAEFSDIPHKRGIVSMARAADPDSAGSQFFIVVEDSRFLDRKYSVFGEVTKGIGVADKIVNLPRDERDNPRDRIEMTVTIVE